MDPRNVSSISANTTCDDSPNQPPPESEAASDDSSTSLVSDYSEPCDHLQIEPAGCADITGQMVYSDNIRLQPYDNDLPPSLSRTSTLERLDESSEISRSLDVNMDTTEYQECDDELLSVTGMNQTALSVASTSVAQDGGYLEDITNHQTECENILPNKYLYQPEFPSRWTRRHLLDGYLFQGNNWLFIKYCGSFIMRAFLEGTIITKNANFFKSQEELQDYKSIMVPLWTNEHDPPNLFVCWRGQPTPDFKNNNLNRKANTAYKSIAFKIQHVLLKAIEKLPESSKTRKHFLYNCNPKGFEKIVGTKKNFLFRILSEDDFQNLAVNFNSDTIYSELKGIESYFFTKSVQGENQAASKVKLISYKLGINYIVKLTENSTPNNKCVNLFSQIRCQYLDHVAFHWAFDFEDDFENNREPEHHVFFDPNLIGTLLERRLGIINPDKYYIGFSKSIYGNYALGNLQYKVPSHLTTCNIRALNIYKKNGADSFKENKLFDYKFAGVSKYLDDDILKKILQANLSRETKWEVDEPERPPALKGPQKGLVNQTLDENMVPYTIKQLRKYWKIGTPCRIEIIVEAIGTTTDKHQGVKSGPSSIKDLITTTHNNVQDWMQENLLPRNVMVRIKNKGCSGKAVGLEKVVDLLFDVYETSILELVNTCRRIYKNKNLLDTSDVLITPFQITRCMVLEACMCRFLSGHFPKSDHVKRILELLEKYPNETSMGESNCVPFDTSILKLLKALKEPSEVDMINLSMLLPDDHWSKQTSATQFLKLRKHFSTVIKDPNPFGSTHTLKDLILSFLEFGLESHPEFRTPAYIETGAINFSNQTSSSNAVSNAEDLRTERIENINGGFHVEYHSTSWVLEIYNGFVCLLPQISSFASYEFIKTKIMKGLHHGEDFEMLWNTTFLECMVKTCQSKLQPIIVGSLAPAENLQESFDFGNLVSQYEPWVHGSRSNCSAPAKKSSTAPRKRKKLYLRRKEMQSNKRPVALVIIPIFEEFAASNEHSPTLRNDYCHICFKAISYGILTPLETETFFLKKFPSFLNDFAEYARSPKVFAMILETFRKALLGYLIPDNSEYGSTFRSTLKLLVDMCKEYNDQQKPNTGEDGATDYAQLNPMGIYDCILGFWMME